MKTDPNDRGETLIELLVTVVIVGVAVVALVGGIATSIRMSDIHRKQAQAGAYLRTYAETIEYYVTVSGKYTPCGTYNDVSFDHDPAYEPKITGVRYWNSSSSAFATVCTSDSGIQKVSLKVSTKDNTVTETLDIIIRKP
ncbi:prepilin-type N-terminal cleavage/methylation domain-containing protein [Dactylosporangium sp. NPDC000555]|uniref:prepilin-type N-terminal cleavage/methylation domain-containing protein n=1 Tax=Dactylosporangium sp. NPDC000555 TaxID=3154260 RepID=UPI00333468EA